MEFQQLIAAAQDIDEWIINLRRTIHRKPELMYEELETSRLVQSTLTELGIPFEANIAETGVLATVGNGNGPCVALRADMDALPIHEQADVDFRSEVDGKMHACGHDCHTAMLLGAAKLLKPHEDKINGTVKLVFQPAEEGGAGGKRMREHGILKNPDVQRIFGLHVWPMVPTGTITSRKGTFLAATAGLDIKVTGRGGHAAMPHMAIDPITTSAKIINELQTIVSRETDPLEPLVISVTAIHAGDAFNVIPPDAQMKGTIRALTMEQMAWAKQRVTDIAEGIAAANQCQANVSFPGAGYPPTVNDADCWRVAGEIWEQQHGAGTAIESAPVMGGEDFSFYVEHVPGCFVGLGIQNEAKGCTYSVHHPMFKVDEDALPVGSAMHAAFAFTSLKQLKQATDQ